MMDDIATARQVYSWAEQLRIAQIDTLGHFHFFHHGIKQNYRPEDSYVIPRGMADCPRQLSSSLKELRDIAEDEPEELWDIIADVEWMLGALARPVSCHQFWVNTAIEAGVHWADKIDRVIGSIPDWGEPAPNWADNGPEKEQFAEYFSQCRYAAKELCFLSENRLRWLGARMSAELVGLNRELLVDAESGKKPPARPRDDTPTETDIKNGQRVLEGMVVMRPSVQAFRKEYRRAGYSASNKRISEILKAINQKN